MRIVQNLMQNSQQAVLAPLTALPVALSQPPPTRRVTLPEGASLDEQLQPPPPLSPEVLWRMRDWGFNVHEVRALRAGVHSTR